MSRSECELSNDGALASVETENGCQYRVPVSIQVGCSLVKCNGCSHGGLCDMEFAPIDPNEEMSEDDMPLVQWAKAEEEEDNRPLVPPPPPVPDGEAALQNTQRRMRQIPQPIAPTRAQKERHNLTHLPYADWCEECVRCRGRNDAHRTIKRKTEMGPDGIPTISMDFAFLGQEGADKSMPMIVLRDNKSKMTFSHGLEGKAVNGEDYGMYVTHASLRDIDFLGYKKVIIKSDQENAIKSLQDRLKRSRLEETVLINAPKRGATKQWRH